MAWEDVLVGLVCVVLLIGGTVGALAFFSLMGSPTSGSHVGYVTAVEESGIVWETKRVYFKTDAASTQEDEYCVTDPAVYQQLESLVSEKHRVRILFERPTVFLWPWKCAWESAIVTGIKEARA